MHQIEDTLLCGPARLAAGVAQVELRPCGGKSVLEGLARECAERTFTKLEALADLQAAPLRQRRHRLQCPSVRARIDRVERDTLQPVRQRFGCLETARRKLTSLVRRPQG